MRLVEDKEEVSGGDRKQNQQGTGNEDSPQTQNIIPLISCYKREIQSSAPPYLPLY